MSEFPNNRRYVPKTMDDHDYFVRESEREVDAHLEMIERRLTDMVTDIRKAREGGFHPTANVIHALTWGVANLNLDSLAGKGAKLEAHRSMRDMRAELEAQEVA